MQDRDGHAVLLATRAIKRGEEVLYLTYPESTLINSHIVWATVIINLCQTQV